MTLETGPFHFGRAEDYARGKAREFPNEGGPAILAVDVSDPIICRAANDWFPLSQGLVQFDLDAGFGELVIAWPTLTKEIRNVP